MAFGFPPVYEETHRFNVHPDYLNAAVSQTVAAMRWPAVTPAPYQVRVSFPFSMLSYGEKMDITIYQDGTVHARSKCVFGFVDWGKNRKNVTTFFGQMIALSGYQPLS
jgi:hypothetical protein